MVRMQVMTRAASIALSLLSAPLLRYPNVCTNYFSLLDALCERCPAIVAQLPPPQLTALLQSVQWGLRDGAAATPRMCLSVVQELAEFDAAAHEKHEAGLANLQLTSALHGLVVLAIATAWIIQLQVPCTWWARFCSSQLTSRPVMLL